MTMIKKTKLAKAIAYAIVGSVMTVGQVSSASASATDYNNYGANAAYISTNAGATDGWNNTSAGWASGSSPFGTAAKVANWAAEITAQGDALTISTQDAHDRYGIWADIDTAKGAWYDGTKGWGHNTDVGLFKSAVDTYVTINATSIQPGGSSETWNNYGISIYTGMNAGDGWFHHGQWNCPSCTATINGEVIQTSPTFDADNPLGGTGLSYLAHDATVDSTNGITFHAIAGQEYSILLGGNSGGSNFGPHAGYSLNISTSPVPVPAAVWLMGSGVLGLVGFQRRKVTV